MIILNPTLYSIDNWQDFLFSIDIHIKEYHLALVAINSNNKKKAKSLRSLNKAGMANKNEV